MKKNKIIIAILLLGSIGLVYYKLTLEDFNEKLIHKMKDSKQIESILSSEDLQVFKEEKKYIEFLNRDVKDFLTNADIKDEFIFNEKVLNSSIKQLQIFNKTKKESLVLTLSLEKKKWKVVLNLLKNREIINIKNEINEYILINEESNYENLIEKYNTLQDLEKKPYTDEISKYQDKLNEKKEYLKNLSLISVNVLKKNKDLIYCDIVNNSEIAINKLIGKLSILDKNGNILFDKQITLYEKNPKYFVNSKAIEPNYRKPVILKSELINTKETFVSIEVIDFQ